MKLALATLFLALVFFYTNAQDTKQSSGRLHATYSNPNGQVDGFMMLPFEMEYQIFQYNGVLMSYKITSSWDNFSTFWYKGKNYSAAVIPEIKQVHAVGATITATLQGACIGKVMPLGSTSLNADHNREVLFKMPADCDLTQGRVSNFEVTAVEYENFNIAVAAIERYLAAQQPKQEVTAVNNTYTNQTAQSKSTAAAVNNQAHTDQQRQAAVNQAAVNQALQKQQAAAEARQKANDQIAQSAADLTNAVGNIIVGLGAERQERIMKQWAEDASAQEKIDALPCHM